MGQLISWLLGGVEGLTVSDQFILLAVKSLYVNLMVLLRIIFGKEMSDRFVVEKELDFNRFMYKTLKLLGLDKFMVLRLYVSKYDYKVCLRINKEDFGIMTSHEDDIIEYFRPNYGDIVVDIGAHIGLYSLIGSKRVGEKGKIIAIEPHPSNFEILNRNIQLNQFTNIITLNCAIYDKNMRMRLYSTDVSGFSGHHSLILKRAEKFIEVNAYTLDYILQSLGIMEVNWIKIDVEGAEFEVLQGAQDILANSKDLSLIIELHSSDLYEPIMELLRLYNCKIEFEKSHGLGHKSIIVRKVKGKCT